MISLYVCVIQLSWWNLCLLLQEDFSKFCFGKKKICIDSKILFFFLSSSVCFSNNVYILYHPDHCSHSRFPALTLSLPILLCLFFGSVSGSSGYPHTMENQVPVGLSTSFPTETTHRSPLREQIPKIGSSFRDSPCCICWKNLKNIELHICYLCARVRSPACVC